MIDTILFDIDDTLLDFRLSEKLSVKAALEQFGLPAEEAVLARYSELNLLHWKMFERGELTLPQVKVRRFEMLFAELGAEASPTEITAAYEERLSTAHYTVEGAEELLRKLSARYALYALSNGTGYAQRRRIREAGFEPFFRDMFFSGELGANKPDPRFFTCAFEKMPGVRRENCLLVGDSLSSDMKGGKNAGVGTVWFNPRFAENETDVHPDYEIHRLSELPDLIDLLNKR